MSETKAIGVRKPAFLLERLAADCAPLQEYRELTANGIQAILKRAREDNKKVDGEVFWDVDWYAASRTGIFKLACIDNGCGMNEGEIDQYINHLSSSGGVQSLEENYGLGARITAGHTNPAGLLYFTWQNGTGIRAHFWKDEKQGVYGLKMLKRQDGSYATTAPVPGDVKPENIDAFGTKVVLCGKKDTDHTVLPPEVPQAPNGKAPGGMKWLTNYLNRRFFKFPAGVRVKVRELSSSDPKNWPTAPAAAVTKGAQVRAVHGMKYFLDRHSESNGSIDLSSATVHWWLLEAYTKSGDRELAESREAWETRGHVAALYQDELYETKRLHEGYRMLRAFGVFYGCERVVLYVEPKNGKVGNRLTSNTARSHLLLNGDRLPWLDWAVEFRDKMPDELKQMMDLLLAASGAKDHLDAIKKRLKAIQEFLRVERYKRISKGAVLVSGNAPGGVSEPAEEEPDTEPFVNPPPPKGSGGGHAGGRKGELYGELLDPSGDPGQTVAPRLREPEVVWAFLATGTRAQDEMEDRAASFDARSNLLKINGDFRVLTNLKNKFVDEFGTAQGIEQLVSDVVDEWYQQQLVETVIGVRTTLEGSRHWAAGSEQLETALSEEALTVAVMPRYHMVLAIKRTIKSQLPALSAQSSVRS